MREIKFKGKAKANGHWVYGSLVRYYDGGCAIVNAKSNPWVDVESVGQYTGLKDRNGKEIYEGDIIKEGDEIFEVYWCEDISAFMHEEYNSKSDAPKMFMMDCLSEDVEIVGNVHDCPNFTPKDKKDGKD